MRCKVKTFMWRACSEALPTKKNLQKRKILDNPECSQCSKGEENTIHALRECETIHCVWDQSFGGVRSDFPRAASFSDLVSLISTQPRKLELFAVVAWRGRFGSEGTSSNVMNKASQLGKRSKLLQLCSQNSRIGPLLGPNRRSHYELLGIHRLEKLRK